MKQADASVTRQKGDQLTLNDSQRRRVYSRSSQADQSPGRLRYCYRWPKVGDTGLALYDPAHTFGVFHGPIARRHAPSSCSLLKLEPQSALSFSQHFGHESEDSIAIRGTRGISEDA